VDNLIPMRVIKPLRNLPYYRKGLFGGQGVARVENLLQGETWDEFHDDATGLVFLVLEGVVNGDDRRVRQSSRRPDLAHEHLLRAVGPFLRRSVKGEDLQGNLAANGGVGGFVDNSHGPPAQFGNDVVSSDLLHGSSSR
jgi:hypothetical protein